MADNNRNRNDQYQQSNDWEENRNRFDEERNRENYRYGNTNYGNDYNQNKGMRSNYGNGQYGDSTKGREMQNKGDYGGSYSSDYGYQNKNYGQSDWQNRGSGQSWQGGGNNQSQQWHNDDWNRRNEGYGDGQQDWQKRSTESNYDAGRNRGFGSGYGSGGYDERYRNTGYGEGRGTGGYSNGNYENRDRWQGNYGNNRSEGNRDWWDRTKDEVSSWFGDDDAERRRRVDKINGPHKGKGPKDYRRSEDRIREDVCDRLADDDYVDASNINVQIQNDEVVLSGTVNSREEKRRAEDVVESIFGVRNVENRIRVGRTDMNFDRYTDTTNDAGGVGRESGTTNEIIRNEKNKK